jgi:DNA repair protein RadC
MKVIEAKISYSLVRIGESVPVNEPEKVVQYMDGAFDEDPTVEWVYAIILNRKHVPIGRAIVSRGTASSSLISPREVFKPAIVSGASAIILVHNHPSGDPAPSVADIGITRTIRDAGTILDIELLDHVIIGDNLSDPNGTGYYSFQEAGLI